MIVLQIKPFEIVCKHSSEQLQAAVALLRGRVPFGSSIVDVLLPQLEATLLKQSDVEATAITTVPLLVKAPGVGPSWLGPRPRHRGKFHPPDIGPFEKGLRMKPFLRWGRTRGPRPRYTHCIQAISAGMGEVYPPRAFPRDGPVPLRRTGVRAPPSGPATGKPISLRKPRFRPTLFNTPTLCVLCASDLPTDDFAPYARRKLGSAGRCKVRNANSTHMAHRRALSLRMA